MTTEGELRERVFERGAPFLDQAEPRWWKRIEERLRMAICDRCVLGQMFGDFREGVTQLVGAYSVTWVIEHGFTTAHGEWDDLDRLWLEAIQARRADPDRYVP